MNHIKITKKWEIGNEEWFYFENDLGREISRQKERECTECEDIVFSRTIFIEHEGVASGRPRFKGDPTFEKLVKIYSNCIKVSVELRNYDECQMVLEELDALFGDQTPLHGKYGTVSNGEKFLLVYSDLNTHWIIFEELSKAVKVIEPEPGCFVYRGCNFPHHRKVYADLI